MTSVNVSDRMNELAEGDGLLDQDHDQGPRSSHRISRLRDREAHRAGRGRPN